MEGHHHGKFTKDNMARKIKLYSWDYIIKEVNDNFKDKTFQFLKLNREIITNLKVNFNLALFEKKLKDILIEYPISSKYRTHNPELNKKLIEKIYAEKKEVAVISLLERTYLDLFENMFIADYLETFLNDIMKKCKVNGSEKNIASIYLENIKKLCLNFKKWFEDKIPRNRV